MATRTEPEERSAAPAQRRAEPAEKLSGVPGHLQAAVQQLIRNQSLDAKGSGGMNAGA